MCRYVSLCLISSCVWYPVCSVNCLSMRVSFVRVWHVGACESVFLHLIVVKWSLVRFWSSAAGCGPGIQPAVALSLIYLILQHVWNLMLFSSLYNEHLTCKNAFVHNDQDTALKSVTLRLSRSLSLSMCLCRGRGISPGWRLPALQILWEVEGKIKPSSRCQGQFGRRHMEMIYDVVIVLHFNSRFLIWKLIL